MHALVPQLILENDRAGNRRGSFPAAGLFVDTSGFTALTEALMAHGQEGAEVLAKVIRSTFGPLIQCVFEQGGFVSSQEGDAFTALFPAEAGDADCSRRALTAALQIQQLAAGQARFSTPYGEFSIQVKIGLGSGEAAWAILPAQDGKRAAYYFRGSAVEACAAAEQHAHAGEIVLNGEFVARMQSELVVEPQEAHFRLVHFKGEQTPARQVQATHTDLEIASRYYPRQLFSWETSGEFRQVAALFVSLPTIRTETQLEIFMQTLFSLQDRYGGVLERLGFGDKGPHLLLFWGAPLAHENDLERLLNFILELQAQTAIPINGGVTYRIAHTGFVGSDLADSFSSFGRGTNLAARLMVAAPRGEIWLDGPAAQRARQRFILEDGGLHAFKGFAQQQEVHILLDRKDQLEPAVKSTLHGREIELERLAEFATPILAGGKAGLLVLWGEPGVGKSSLAQALRYRLAASADRPFQFMQGQCDEILRFPLNPFCYWLRQAFQISDSQGENRNKRAFNHKLEELIRATQDARLADELDRTRSFLGALLDLHWPDSLYEQLDAKGRYENTLLALTAYFKAESLRQPVLFLLEDAHWLDDDSQAYLPQLFLALNAAQQPYPVALLVTARREGARLELKGIPAREILLERLSHPALAQLAESRLGGSPSPGLLDLLEGRSEGNPFFSEQIIQYLQEENLLVQGADGWQVKDSRQISLPTDVGSLLVARLDRLAQEVKEGVQTASILGREFDLPLLSAMLPNQLAFSDLVVRSEAENIWSRLSEVRCSFQHALLHDAAYQMQNHSRRQMLHHLALQVYQAAYAANPQDHYGEFAYHAEQAGLSDQALEYYELAGRAAQDAYQNHLAEEYISRALDLVPQGQVEKRFELLLVREAIYEIQGKFEPRRQDLGELEALAAQQGDAPHTLEAMLRKANYSFQTGVYPQANRFARQAVEMAEAQGAWEKAVAGYKSLAVSCLRQGQFGSAVSEAQKGLALAVRFGYSREESLLWNLLGLIAIEQGSLDEARASFERSLEIGRRSNRLLDQAPALHNLGMVSGMQGDHITARGYYQQALEISRKTGDRRNEGLGLGNLGWIEGNIGEYAAAQAYSEQFHRISREVGDPNGEVYSLVNLSAYAIFLNDPVRAEGCALEAMQLARKIGDRSAEAWALTYLGHCYLETGRAEEAAAVYRAAIDIRTELEQPVLALEPRAGLGSAELKRKDLAAALEQVEVILAHLSRAGLEGTDEPVRVYLSCWSVLQAAADRRAGELLESGWQFLQARASAIQDEETRRKFLENNPFHRQLLAAWRASKQVF